MHVAINAVPTSVFCSASTCPTSGSIAALARWKVNMAAVKISNLRS
jgi:hypothetical protein